ncbi:alpha-L-arabinofuranosidase [Flavobacterium sp. Sd200]|uniref:alpha-L-arabinofuranosidase C-terminal domain-containing protein n=1 Tax=Flavobacterium sp. Sd200 TaxID=2692211 RepID=UPI0013692AD3|nr:alpha-L-arabinofuranosidase C-terminal domain-containing protein [Flavobacterium sp. Sd200]MXN89666.1 alpha-L-arabinofuranosidase [Flavobacterium sp. Sd200]
MKKYYLLFFSLLVLLSGKTPVFAVTNFKDPGKVYLFAYATTERKGQNGLHFAWSNDKKNWYTIGPEHSFLKCDYGRWGSQKRMLTPYLFKDNNGLYHCVWSVNENDAVFAHATSGNLTDWNRQTYVPTVKDANVIKPQISFANGLYTVAWQSEGDKAYSTTTKDFKKYGAIQSAKAPQQQRQNITIAGKVQEGTVIETDWETVTLLKKTVESIKFKNQANAATAKSDSALFANLKPFTASIAIDKANTKKISDMLVGVFFEDINYAADGGLYAELVQNRDFEYAPSDKEGRDKNWNTHFAWSGTYTIDSLNPIHQNNRHYAVLKNSSIANEGFDGIALKAGEKYDVSIFAKGSKLTIKLKDADGKTLAETSIKPNSNWKKYTAVLKPSKTVTNAKLEVTATGESSIDMVSLFPQNTFKGRKNGLRNDLAQTVANLHPKFVRFPGGCVAHGDGLGNIYRWKNTIGPLESRTPMRNLWGYHQTMGLGYYEYFLYCEDMGAQPVPVLAAGVPCQNSGVGGAGQQFGIPMEHMDEYVQDVLDLIEYANGSVNTTWGKKRAEAGHPKPFNLKYIGIGNEDLITDVFEERYTLIVNAVRKKYPEITVIGTVGPFFEGTDYREGWDIADKLKLPMVDEHYYESPGWFINNQDFYDSYDRSRSKVYLGEYASRGNAFYNALAEALYLTSLERNGDVVSMTSYAPLLAREKHTQWNPDLIYFSGSEVKPTVNYFVQQLYGENPGDIYLQSSITTTDNNSEVSKRIASSVVQDSATGDVIIKLVNALPVAVTPSVNLNGLATKDAASYTVLTDKPDSKTSRPAAVKISAKEALSKELPPYSFTVIRLKTR